MIINTEEDIVNQKFNDALNSLTPENADSVILKLGRPSYILRSVGIANKDMRLYGNKVMKKARKHGLDPSDLKNLPNAVNNPIAVFEGSRAGSHAILTELKTTGDNVSAAVEVGKNRDAIFNIVTSAYPKENGKVINWINGGKLLYANKEKTLNYLSTPAPIAGATDNQGLKTAVKTAINFINPDLPID